MSRIKAIILTIALVIGISGAAALEATQALAGSGNQWCDDFGYCPNAWGGGPFVKSYGYPAVNNDFTAIGSYGECNHGVTTSTCPGHGIPAGEAIVSLEFTGGGKWNGMCIGDAYNQPGHSDSSLDPCPTPGNNGGWGVNFVQLYHLGSCTASQDAYWNIHWSAFLNFSDGNGNTVVLNSNFGPCLTAQPPR